MIGRILRVWITIIETRVVGSILVVVCLLGLCLGLLKRLIHAGECTVGRSLAFRRKDHALHNVRTIRPPQDHVVKARAGEYSGHDVAFRRRTQANCYPFG